MKKLVVDTWRFHEKMRMAYYGNPRQLPQKLFEFRANFLQEELDELRAARAAGDLGKQLDALIDISYVAAGTLQLMGIIPDRAEEAWNRVQSANMAKRRAEAGEDRSGEGDFTFNVVKPEGWTAPVMDDLVAPYTAGFARDSKEGV